LVGGDTSSSVPVPVVAIVVGVAVAGRGKERCRGSIDAETSDEAKTKENAIGRKMVTLKFGSVCKVERGSPSTRVAMAYHRRIDKPPHQP